jgi:predicted Zn-dependent peptidase
MQVLSTVLGGYFGSRLMQNLRERNGFTYGVFSAMVNFQQTGYLAIATQVGTEVTERALEEIAAEIEILRTELIPEEELELVKNIMAGEMMRILDGPFGIADVTTENILCGFDNSQIQHNLERIRRTTPEELLSLAQKYLNPADITTVIAGDFN